MNPALDYRTTTTSDVPPSGHFYQHQCSGAQIEAGAGWPELLQSLPSSSTGLMVLVYGYPPFFPYLQHVGTSPGVVVPVLRSRSGQTHAREASQPTYGDVLATPIADQTREVLAALALNKSQLAEVLRVSRPTLYDWLDGKEPNPLNSARMVTLFRLLARVGITSSTPLNAKFVRQPLAEGASSLVDELTAERWDEKRIENVLREARALGAMSESRRRSREDRLRNLGYDEPSDDDRKKLLSHNLAMRDWPKP